MVSIPLCRRRRQDEQLLPKLTMNTVMSKNLHIDFVSDVVCPWCAIGLHSLESALRALDGKVDATIEFHPFEINPTVPTEGEDLYANLARKYGNTREQTKRNQEAIQARGEEIGFAFNMAKRTHYYNTFDAHRLLHWAEKQGKQQALKKALVSAYFTHGEDVSSHAVLERIAGEVGLDATMAREIISTDRFAKEVREREAYWRNFGIQSVPTLIVNGQYVVQGSQSPEAYAEILQKIAIKA
jgi:predicted DsbA family dithiol-disulfide isomerase